MFPVLTFDIETVPDISGLRRLYQMPEGMADQEVAQAAFLRRRQSAGNDFLPLHLHRVIAIACALRDRNQFVVWSLGDEQGSEAQLLQRFFDGLERYTPQLVSWNGGGFDLPVLHYRSLIHGVKARRYWELGDEDRDFRYNNYISRYHTRHVDLMDLLSLYQSRAAAPLDDIARLLGFPGKLGMNGSEVWDAYRRGELANIRGYCETDVVNTYLVFLRFQMMRGVITSEQYEQELDIVHATLARSPLNHWKEFISAWQRSPQSDPASH